MVCSFFFLLASISSGLAQPAATGILTGRVFNSASNGYVANARVTVPGTSLVASTDQSGTFTLYGVPRGEARVHVDYVGFAA